MKSARWRSVAPLVLVASSAAADVLVVDAAGAPGSLHLYGQAIHADGSGALLLSNGHQLLLLGSSL